MGVHCNVHPFFHIELLFHLEFGDVLLGLQSTLIMSRAADSEDPIA